MKKSDFYKRIICRENIFNAIYSLRSYVFEKELLFGKDIILYNELQDKYNIEKINETIDICVDRIENILDDENSDNLFKINVFFKPKKKDSYRPIHTADLITQICIVSLLNPIMFDDSSGKRKLSDISRLLPANFYGNIPSIQVDTLFKPWSKQYQEYTQRTIESSKEYCKSGKYENEVNLDLKCFFPSINPLYIYDFILDKWPITCLDNDKECLERVLKKLLFFEVKIPKEWHSIYFADNYERIKKSETFYNIGIPQGLPQAFFFGNLSMLFISKEIDEVFKGESFYYVDDSVIYTNQEIDGFKERIENLNKTLNKKIEKQISTKIISKKIHEFHKKINYKLIIHDDEKSSISKISNEDALLLLAKPASSISFEMNASMDEIEDTSLLSKIKALLGVINSTLDNDEINKVNENKLILLKRYRKFYTNRYNALILREDNEITQSKIEDYYIKYGINNFDKLLFFKRLEDDVFYFESKVMLRQLFVDKDSQDDIILKVKSFENNIFGKDDVSNHYFSTVFSNYIEILEVSEKSYESLDRSMKEVIGTFDKVKQSKKKELLKSLIDIIKNPNKKVKDKSGIRIRNLILKYKNGDSEFIFNNSAEYERKIINALVSRIFNVQLSDNCNIIRLDSRAVNYYELRILMLLRSYGYTSCIITENICKIIDDLESNFEKIDLLLLEVLPIFKKYIKDSQKIDILILVHKYVNGIWKNGSKFLHFYTLHNEEHSIELIKSCTKITKIIDYLSVKSENYYLLFLACYLHDISMVLYPNLDEFSEVSNETDLIYSNWKISISKLLKTKNIDDCSKKNIKRSILKYYNEVNNYFEKKIRDNHHRRSASFIKTHKDLSFIDTAIRRFVAEISEGHGYNTEDVYKLKSKAKDDIYDEKYLMIILRLADLFDMSKDRVSVNILRQNIKNMSDVSKYHWISHLATDNCSIQSKFLKIDATTDSCNKEINETIQIIIDMNTKLNISMKSVKCKNFSCKLNKDKSLSIKIEKGSVCAKKCNFMCRWVMNKHWYLFKELFELHQYLDRNVNNLFKTEFEVIVNLDDTSTLPADYMDIIKNEINK